jgi:hypothetical protein
MKELTLEDLKRLQEGYDCASIGKWNCGSGYEQSDSGNYIVAENGIIVAAEQDDSDCVLRLADACHIVDIHNALPALVELAKEALVARERKKYELEQSFKTLGYEEDHSYMSVKRTTLNFVFDDEEDGE